MTTSTGESAEEIPAEVLQRWDLSAIKEYLKRIWASMQGEDERGAIDYEETIADRVARIISRKYGRWHVQQQNGNSDSNWKTIALFVMGFLQALILAFMGYIYSATSQTHDDVIRIKCRLDPQSCMGSANARP